MALKSPKIDSSVIVEIQLLKNGLKQSQNGLKIVKKTDSKQSKNGLKYYLNGVACGTF
jgi:hypothetical protein